MTVSRCGQGRRAPASSIPTHGSFLPRFLTIMSKATDTDSDRHAQAQTLELYDENNDEHRSLPKVPGGLTWPLFVVCVVELGERFVYLGINSPLQNYIQNPYPYNHAGIPGALDRGQAVSVALGNFFKFWSYICVVGGAVVSGVFGASPSASYPTLLTRPATDQYLGKFKTIVASTPIYVLGMAILVATSTPVAIQHNASMAGLIVATILIGIGTGGLKACIAPMCGEQSRVTQSYVRTKKDGAREVVDVKMTSARIYLWYYWAANLGSLSGLATTALEKSHSFWMAYLLPLVVFLVTFVVFLLFRNRIVHVPPSGSPIVDAWHAVRIAIREKGFANASPSALTANGRIERYKFATNERYTDRYVADIKSGVSACKYFILFPFFFVAWIQSFSNLISQAGSMDIGATPNDLMVVMSTIFMLGLIPLLDCEFLPKYPQTPKLTLDFPFCSPCLPLSTRAVQNCPEPSPSRLHGLHQRRPRHGVRVCAPVLYLPGCPQ